MIFTSLLLTASAILSDEIAMARGSDRPSEADASIAAKPAAASKGQPASAQPPKPTAGYRPSLQKDYFYAGAEWLFWRTDVGETHYAVTHAVDSGASASFEEGKEAHPSFNWDGGWRIRVGGALDRNWWDVEGVFTHFGNFGSSNINTTNNGNIVGSFPQGSGTSVLNAGSNVKLTLNWGDILLGKRFIPMPRFLFRFLTGVTGGQLRFYQPYSFNALGGPTTTNGMSKWRFYGAGARMGIAEEWYFGAGFGLVGFQSIALIYGQYNNSFKTTQGATTHQNARYSDHRIAPQLQLSLAPTYGLFMKDWGFSVSAAYELNSWMNVQELHASNSNTALLGRTSNESSAFVSVQGLTLATQIYY